MPTYEYECLSCGISFDAFQKMSDAPLQKCTECQGSVRRVVSGGSGLIFKGSGFYITDYNKKDKKSTAPSSEVKSSGKNKPASKSKKDSSK
ncbi:MAG: zinc ribbon domain-containing protein [Candidatus Marinimicrobia bacterium]|nr:zinc ribbon domain-containing protein [Candidatus Neomarinimicrobiota bacterium]